MTDELDDRLDRIGRHPFRARFRLRGRDGADQAEASRRAGGPAGER